MSILNEQSLGKVYITRGGDRVTITQYSGLPTEVDPMAWRGSEGFWYYADGKISAGMENPQDITHEADVTVWHIVEIDASGIKIIGPFDTERAAADFGHTNMVHPRWHVADIGHPAPNGMAGEEYVNDPCYVIAVQAPWVA